jgi:Flp pilus assembly protein TadD
MAIVLDTQDQIHLAWREHRVNNNSAAIEIFQTVLKSQPKDLDALYGLGLAQRSNGDMSKAVVSFEKALGLAQDGLNAIDNTSILDGSNNLATDQDDRFLMLATMIKQRLAELGQ